jgi:UDP-N-acetyl-D-mannosaminuronate dehydrogenase
VPRVATVNGTAIFVYFRDHSPPHFHATTGGSEALIVIGALVVLESTLAPSTLAIVLAWAADHRADLTAAWNRCNP